MAAKDHNWSYDDASTKDNKKAEAKAGSVDAKVKNSQGVKNWTLRPPEKARRIWCWWKLNGRAGNFSEMDEWVVFARMAAINQASSAASERIFSLMSKLVEMFTN